MKSKILAVSILLTASSTVWAAPPADTAPQTGTASTVAANTEAEPAEEKKICRTERMTGSLTRRTRICMTEAQWRQIEQDTKRSVDEMSRPADNGVRPGPLG